jgi:DNA-binding XRE family transcriptional regulator
MKPDAFDDLAKSLGLTLSPKIREHIGADTGKNGISTATLIAGTLERFRDGNAGLIAIATDRKISAERYLVAEFLSEPKKNAQEFLMRGQSAGTKSEMATMLDVSKQALWKYETKYFDLLRTLRVDFAISTECEFRALAIRLIKSKSAR